jgi:hypothetical protein
MRKNNGIVTLSLHFDEDQSKRISGFIEVSSSPKLVSVDGIYPLRGSTLAESSYLDSSLSYAASAGYKIALGSMEDIGDIGSRFVARFLGSVEAKNNEYARTVLTEF